MAPANFTISGVNKHIGTELNAEADKIGKMVKNFDPDDPAAEFKMQMEVSKYKAEVGLMSALVKDINDVQQQVLQKV